MERWCVLHGLAGGSQRGGGAARPARQSPRDWLAKAEGPDCMSSDGQRDLTSGMLKVNSSALREWGGQEDTRRESCSAPEDRAQLSRGTKALASAISLSHPQPKFQREPVPLTELAYTTQTLCMLCFCGSIPPTGLPPFRCFRAPPTGDHLWQRELSLLLQPLYTLRSTRYYARSHRSSTASLAV